MKKLGFLFILVLLLGGCVAEGGQQKGKGKGLGNSAAMVDVNSMPIYDLNEQQKRTRISACT